MLVARRTKPGIARAGTSSLNSRLQGTGEGLEAESANGQ